MNLFKKIWEMFKKICCNNELVETIDIFDDEIYNSYLPDDLTSTYPSLCSVISEI